MRNFKGKGAAITGAGSGIGRALALNLAARGCHLALCDINETALDSTADHARQEGARVYTQCVDVANREQVEAWAEAARVELGAIHLVVNNAGVALINTVENARHEDLEWIMGINFWGVVHGTKAFLPHLLAQGEGHIVNVSSVFGLAGIPSQCGYNAAKFAVRGFTDCLRAELEIMNRGVSCTCVHPGGIKTNIARAARRGGSVAMLGMDDEDDGSGFEKVALTTPEKAAAKILWAVERNKRRVLVGPDAYLFDWATRLFPAHYQRLAAGVARLGAKRK